MLHNMDTSLMFLERYKAGMTSSTVSFIPRGKIIYMSKELRKVTERIYGLFFLDDDVSPLFQGASSVLKPKGGDTKVFKF